jgi:autotransporter strand-loop-strand O-heptosyltransferase
LDLQNKRVYIALDSKSLGDTLAWIPYVEEFRKKHSCKVICSTFWNDLFIEQYPEIEFVKPGNTVHDLTAMYVVGLFYIDNNFDSSKHPTNPITIPLQQIASDILGLPYTEIRPKIKQPIVSNTDSKVVTIATHSTAQTKYWNNPFGWQQVVDWLRERGYTVKLMSQEEDGYMGNKNPTGVEQFPKSSIDKVIEELKRSKVFIGVSSGLSWVSWAAGVPTVMISGFTEPMNEMKSCIRISAPKGKCSGCWNRHKFDAGDWNWCPDHKGTPRQFECSREITSDTVIRELDKILTKQEYTDFLLKNYSTWEGHGLFAIDLVERINPSVTVDLGVDTGFSTFCLAYSNNGQVYGIDTFQGDMFSGYRDTMSVVESVREEVKTLYNVSGINIIRGYFDDVAKTWDKPIDLLHIDGLHTYDAVKNDFETWTKFCKDDAIILFHDVETYSDTVGRFFSEINDGFKIIRKGSHGLGIYTKSKERFNIIQQMLI